MMDEDLQELQAEAMEKLLVEIRDTDDPQVAKQYSEALDKLGKLICDENRILMEDKQAEAQLEFEKEQKAIENEAAKKASKWDIAAKIGTFGIAALQLVASVVFIAATHKTEEESYDKTPGTNRMTEKLLDRVKFK